MKEKLTSIYQSLKEKFQAHKALTASIIILFLAIAIGCYLLLNQKQKAPSGEPSFPKSTSIFDSIGSIFKRGKEPTSTPTQEKKPKEKEPEKPIEKTEKPEKKKSEKKK